MQYVFNVIRIVAVLFFAVVFTRGLEELGTIRYYLYGGVFLLFLAFEVWGKIKQSRAILEAGSGIMEVECPRCKEQFPSEVTVCRACGYDLQSKCEQSLDKS